MYVNPAVCSLFGIWGLRGTKANKILLQNTVCKLDDVVARRRKSTIFIGVDFKKHTPIRGTVKLSV
jgi:hypothetical protein